RLAGVNRIRIVADGLTPGVPYDLRYSMRYHAQGHDPQNLNASIRSKASADGRAEFDLRYHLFVFSAAAYSGGIGEITLAPADTPAIAGRAIRVGIWTPSSKLALGALYLRPDQKQFVRMTLGLTQPFMGRVKSMHLEVVRLGDGKVLKAQDVDASPKAILE